MEGGLLSQSREGSNIIELLRFGELISVSSCFTIVVPSGICASVVGGITGVDFPDTCGTH